MLIHVDSLEFASKKFKGMHNKSKIIIVFPHLKGFGTQAKASSRWNVNCWEGVLFNLFQFERSFAPHVNQAIPNRLRFGV